MERSSSLDTRVVQALSGTPPRTIAELAAELGAPPFAIRVAIKRLRGRGRIVAVGRQLEYRSSFGARSQHWASTWTVTPQP
jgi:DNA-binding Lrp family transcriptional regulator